MKIIIIEIFEPRVHEIGNKKANLLDLTTVLKWAGHVEKPVSL